MSDQQSFKSGDDDAPQVTRDAAGDAGVGPDDRKPFPSGAELRAAVCRAAWDAAVALETVERSWHAAQRSPSDRAASPILEYYLSLPTLNGEGLRQFVSTGRDANGVEGAWGRDRSVGLQRSWSADPTLPPNLDGGAGINRWERYDFARPNHCDSVRTSVSVIFDPDHSIDALNDFFDALQDHGANFELERDEITSFTVEQVRKPSGEEMLHLGTARLQPDTNWQRHAITKPRPGFMASAEQVVDHAGIILSEPFGVWFP